MGQASSPLSFYLKQKENISQVDFLKILAVLHVHWL